VCATLSRVQALDEAWIEDGFVQALRSSLPPAMLPRS
jgi:hypothetical protein